ncbi:MAG: UDP-N-acetylmuramate:L-alanyl-gamma-D-glutamyl-meso-diaminopimelate ligase [Verrucomicrobiaceae bacterium]|nr:MAG: UDP-N-acetylmuramate:L-alanyl-gamma-D-glutamyl-meso-diaminopimelate ligase [Verrucomicrobiaceae bacterium]
MVPTDQSHRHFHFIGICGTAMGAVAAAMKDRGYTVTGSDLNVYPPMSDFLADKGIVITSGNGPDNIPDGVSLVIIGNAMSRGNAQLEEVLDRKIAYTSLPALLKDEFLKGKRNIVATGTHGKTTTSSMVAHILKFNGHDPSHMIGGIPLDLGQGGKFTDSDFFVLEGDEYDTAFFDKRSKFIHYLPEVVIVNNIEFDHADIFKDIDDIKLSFKRMLNIVPRNGIVFVNGDDSNAIDVTVECPASVIKVGVNDACEHRIQNMIFCSSSSSFTLNGFKYEVPMHGEFNVRNAAMAVSASLFVGLEESEIAEALANFSGVARRQEFRGEESGVKIIDDFGHHPTAIGSTIDAIRQRYEGSRIWALFEPRSNTSRRNLMQDQLESALSKADGIFISEVPDPEKVPSGELLNVEVVIKGLKTKGKIAFRGSDSDEIVEKLIPLTEPNDVVIVLSNGGFGGIHAKLLQGLR